MTVVGLIRARPVRRRLGLLGTPVVALLLADLAVITRRPLVVASGFADDWLVLLEIGLGLGFAATGIAALGRRRPAPALLLAGGFAFLAGPLGRVVPSRTWMLTTAVTGAVLLALGVLRIPGRDRVRPVFTALDVAVLVTGVACGATALVDLPRLSITLGLVGGAALFCAGWLHVEFSTGDDRRRVLWLILGVTGGTLGVLLIFFLAEGTRLSPWAVAVTSAAVGLLAPLGAAIALLNPRAYDVRAALSRTVVGAGMLTLTVSVFVGGASVYRLVAGEPPSLGVLGVLVTVIAAGYHPVLVRVRDTADELLFGGRADPVETLTLLGSELSAGSSPQEWLRALRLALGVPAVELRTQDRTVARSGDDPGNGSEVTSLRLGAEPVGELVVSLPPEQLRLPATTRAVLDLVAGPLAQAVHATRLAAQLQASRGRVVAALEEERRRVRRDLHDGLGPTLTGIAYSADAARNLVSTDPAASVALLRDLRADTADAIAEIRRIVYGLRPRAIDELGLVAAVRQQVSRLGTADGRPLRVALDAPDALPDLPAAVEVVAYRVAVEAVTNVARHAGVDEATLRFAVRDGSLDVEVCDGGGSGTVWTPGVGLAGMRERVEEVGGLLTVETAPGRNRVSARIPLPDDAHGDPR